MSRADDRGRPPGPCHHGSRRRLAGRVAGRFASRLARRVAGRLAWPRGRSRTRDAGPHPARAALLLGFALLGTFAAAACGGSHPKSLPPPRDAGPERVPDSDGGTKGVALDFAATGCAAFDSATYRCRGTAPLTISFVAIATEELTRVLWTFGDSTPPSSEPTARHTYTVPGLFNVTLVAGARSGTLSRERNGFVDVVAASTGDGCDVDLQCAKGLTCLCGAAAACHAVFRQGLCSRSCNDSADACPADTICADLSLSAAQSLQAGPPDHDLWRQPLCLRACVGPNDCRPGQICRDVPVRGGDTAWKRACFPVYPLAVGSACRGVGGALEDRDCITGLCADLGASGRCSRPCHGDRDCPSGTRCARLNDGRSFCLGECAPGQSCADDPLLACEDPGAPGPLGFTVVDTASASAPPRPARLCGPKRCNADADCGPAGACDGHCRRRSGSSN